MSSDLSTLGDQKCGPMTEVPAADRSMATALSPATDTGMPEVPAAQASGRLASARPDRPEGSASGSRPLPAGGDVTRPIAAASRATVDRGASLMQPNAGATLAFEPQAVLATNLMFLPMPAAPADQIGAAVSSLVTSPATPARSAATLVVPNTAAVRRAPPRPESGEHAVARHEARALAVATTDASTTLIATPPLPMPSPRSLDKLSTSQHGQAATDPSRAAASAPTGGSRLVEDDRGAASTSILLQPAAGSDETAAGKSAPPLIDLAAAMSGAAAPTTSPVLAAPAVGNPSPATTPRAPSAQVASAIVALTSRADGSNEMTVSLHPHDLGKVDIHLTRGSDGSTTVTVTATETKTLQELSQAAHHLHAALDAANIPAENRSLSFAVTAAAASDHRPTDPGRSDSATSQQSDGSSADGQGKASHQQKTGRSAGIARDDGTDDYAAEPGANRRTWQVSGLNITA